MTTNASRTPDTTWIPDTASLPAMSKHRVEPLPQGSTYGPAFPLMMLLALAITETIALSFPACASMGFCG